MGAFCGCNQKNSLTTAGISTLMRDPRLSELQTHLKILDAKLNSNLQSIDDFKQLLIETKKEPIPHQDILKMINQIEEAFEEAKQSFQQVQLKRNQAKQVVEQVDNQLQMRGFPETRFRDNNNRGNTPGILKISDTEDSQSQEIKTTIDQIYKKISEAHKLIKKAEEESQVQMLNWENFVIQHEKMKKLREDIGETFNLNTDKLKIIEQKHKELKGMIQQFQDICSIQELCQNEISFAFANSSMKSSEYQDDLIGNVAMINILTESFEEEERNQETEQLMEMKSKLQTFSQKVEHSKIDLNKFSAKLQLLLQKREELNEFDIYELDSFYKKLQDFFNNIEISLLKLNSMLNELKSKQDSGYLFDFCENLFMRKLETKQCLEKIDQASKECKKILAQSENSSSTKQTGGGSATNMIQRGAVAIKQIKGNMNENLKQIEKIEQAQLDFQDFTQMESVMMKLAQIQKEAFEANRTINEEYMLIQKIQILNGVLGWKINVADIYQEKSNQLEKLKNIISQKIEQLKKESIITQDIIGKHVIINSEEVNDYKEILDRLQTNYQQLIEKYKLYYEQIIEIDTNLDRWQSNKSAASISVLEGVEYDDQDPLVQELINIQMSIASIMQIQERLNMISNKNWRILKRTELKLMNKNCQQLNQQISLQIENNKQIAIKVEQKITQLNSSKQYQKAQKVLQNSSQSVFNSIHTQEYYYDEQSKSLKKLQKILDNCEQEKYLSDEQLDQISIMISQAFQNSVIEYSKLFQDQENIDQLWDKFKNLENKYISIMKQVKELNSEMHQISVYLQKQFKIMGNDQIKFMRSESIDNESFLSSYNNANRLQLNSTLGDDDLGTSQILTSTAMMDEIDQAIVKCLEEQKCFNNLNIEKVRKGVYRLEKKEYQFKMMPGNNLAIRMFAGYIFTDCLVHFDEELILIVKN